MISVQEMVAETAKQALEDFVQRGIGFGDSESESQISVEVIIRRLDDDFPKRLTGKRRWGSSIIARADILYVFRDKRETAPEPPQAP